MITKEVFMDIIAMKRAGHSEREISRKLGIHRETVKKYLKGDSFPAYRRKKGKPSILEPYHQVIRDFLAEDDIGRPGSWSVSAGWATRAVTTP